jgi:hypothetical protein
MHVSRMTTWADLWDATKGLAESDRSELARFLNFAGVADEIARLEGDLANFRRVNVGPKGLMDYVRSSLDSRKQIEIDDAIEEQLAIAMGAWRQKAETGEAIHGLNGHDLNAIQRFLESR